MPAHKKNPLQLVPNSIKHNAGRYKDRLENTVNDERPLEMPQLSLITFETAWALIVDMAPEGVLRKSDTAAVEQAAWDYMAVRNAELMQAWGHTVELPKDHHTRKKSLAAALARFGAYPADRGKVTAVKPKDDLSDFD